ncbi:efflux RND transporter permease subunit [Methylophaga sulfidovorans]|uniref:Multidrug efflux pump subunit AcrB n=1 Tax=Methylophaga sulfidovorans TaxID=45496 RepID=A0A1I3ZB37_9GAMM|nr:efflux RND transporter permease subunit [Methylophaga sulfidovorans]SFK41225.1 Multidrug efflux pump subunit AcrB [Methylophaga sulfidovorans]
MSSPAHRKDIIGIFAQHKVAANLLMLMMLIGGFVSLSKLNTQFFPNFALDVITVSVVWRGASAEDVEDSLTSRIEQELRTIDYVDKMTSTSSYGSSLVRLEFDEGTDMGPALDQVKDHVARLRNLPKDSETPEISIATRYDNVARLLVTTDGHLDELRGLVHQIEHELLDAGISRVTITGLPDEEMAIKVSTSTLESLGLSFGDVSQRVADQSQDLPAGEIGNAETTRQIRSLDQRRDADAFGNISLKSDYQGRRLLINDVADVERRAMRDQVKVFYHGKPAVEIALQRTENADALESARIMENWLEQARPSLPKGVDIRVYDASWSLIQERINLLLSNGLSGLLLVLAILFLFLHGRVAFWVAVGIPVSFMAALTVLYVLGGSINMISLFALIMALGIIVDDAIVVGEDALSHYQSGERSLLAAEGGARRMLAPVISSSLTTIAAFLPLMLISGIIGNILFDIPFVVICVIIASLVESFLILPGHLRHTFHTMHHADPGCLRRWLDEKFDHFREQFFRPLVSMAVKNSGVTISLTLALLIISISLLASGRILFNFFPSPEGTTITANVRFVAGTPKKDVEQFLQNINLALDKAEADYDQKIVKMAVTRLGSASSANSNLSSSQSDERFGSVQLEMISPDKRDIRNKDFINDWRKYIILPPGIETFTISEARGGPPGSDIDIRLSGAPAQQLKKAAHEVAERLKNYTGVSAIEDDMPYGQEQLIYRIKGQGEVLGLTVENVGRQLRAAFDGQLVQIFQDGDDEVEVRVMLPDAERNTLATLENFMLRLPNGGSAPLSSVVDFESRRGFDVLRHTESQLAIHITASVDSVVNNNNVILDDMKKAFLPEISSKYGVKIGYEGRAEEQADTMSDMAQGTLLAFVMIYLVLAWVFSSYGWPLVVMAAIPFGLIGALIGHWLLGIDLTILSLFGIFGLSGIVVNDSIILVTFFKQLTESGTPTQQAIIEASVQRLRAVLLTSLTTIAGLTPLLFETSLQAQFLIPMAVSMSFGLMFSTVLVLLVIPAMLAVYERIADKLLPKRTESVTI